MNSDGQQQPQHRGHSIVPERRRPDDQVRKDWQRRRTHHKPCPSLFWAWLRPILQRFSRIAIKIPKGLMPSPRHCPRRLRSKVRVAPKKPLSLDRGNVWLESLAIFAWIPNSPIRNQGESDEALRVILHWSYRVRTREDQSVG